MKVFISSLIAGYERFRSAAAVGGGSLGHQILRAEDFSASPGTPQQACLAAVHEADVVLLLLGARYGAVQASGLSATHEEYQEARDAKPVVVFVESGVQREDAQQALVDEVQAWSSGHFRASYTSVEELQAAVVRALHEYELAMSSGKLDESEMLERAMGLAPRGSGGGGQLIVVVAGGPYQQVIRPADLEAPALARDLQREALFGDDRVFDASQGTEVAIRANALALTQQGASLTIDGSF